MRVVAFTLAMLMGLPLAASEEASEEEPRYTISLWQGAQGCRDQDHFRALLEEALGPGEGTATPPLPLSIRIEKSAGTFRLSLTTGDKANTGTRELQAPQCDELLATAAVIVSLAMQPDLLYQNESEHQVIMVPFVQGQAIDDETPSDVSASNDPRESLLGSDASSSRLRIAFSLAALGDVGTLPRPAVGLALVASARSERYRLAFRLTQWAEQRRYVSSFRPDRGGNFDYLSASLDLCRDLWSGPVIAGACAVGGLGRLSGESIVIDLPVAQAHVMATAGSALFVEVRTGGTSTLRVQGELVAQLVRPDYNVEVLDEEDDSVVIKMHIHQPAPVALRLAASWGLTF